MTKFRAMKVLIAAAMVFALQAVPVQAQQVRPGSAIPSESGPSTTTQERTRADKADEEAYKSAVRRIPQPKEGFDPWRVAREKPESR